MDTEQNLENTSALLSGDLLTVNFTRPIISPDKTQDLDLNVCQYVIYVFNGAVVGSFSSPSGFNITFSIGFGVFQLCLQYCQGKCCLYTHCVVIVIVADVHSPSTTTASSTVVMSTATISTTSAQSSSSISTSISASATTPTPTASSPSGASGMFASVLLIMIAVAIVLHVTV